MAENKEYISREEELGNINISEEVLSAIAGAAALEVEGVAGLGSSFGAEVAAMVNRKSLTRSVRLDLENEEVCVGIAVLVKYGHVVPDVAKEVQEAVKSALENTSGLNVVCVNVTVAGVAFGK